MLVLLLFALGCVCVYGLFERARDGGEGARQGGLLYCADSGGGGGGGAGEEGKRRNERRNEAAACD